MSPELQILILTAITISCLHTLAGPDHYLPFIALARTRGWSFRKTVWWTVVCGCGHVWSSVLLGLGGAAIGWSLSKAGWLQSVRGSLAGWGLIFFGLIYCTWGIIRAGKGTSHKHFDIGNDGAVYVFEHRHDELVIPRERHKVTPWVMFVIFLLGPCEPMIPLLYFPAAKNSTFGLITLIATYTVFTLLTMLTMVFLGYYGFSFLKTSRLEKYMHAIGGFAILSCGAGMVFLGL
jgi:hypothetical protein